MPNLDTYTTPLTIKASSHLFRRATFGPTKQEIAAFVGITATQAVDILFDNVNSSISFHPLNLDSNSPEKGNLLMSLPFNTGNNFYIPIILFDGGLGQLQKINLLTFLIKYYCFGRIIL